MNFRYLFIAIGLFLIAMAGWALADFHAFIHFFGIDTQQSDNYDFFSGPGPVFVTVLFGSGVFFTVWAHLNCHVDGCPRVGRFPVAGGQYKVCRAHHGDVTGRKHGHLTAGLLRDLHLAHHGKDPAG